MKCYAMDLDCKDCQHEVLCEIAIYVKQLEETAEIQSDKKVMERFKPSDKTNITQKESEKK